MLLICYVCSTYHFFCDMCSLSCFEDIYGCALCNVVLYPASRIFTAEQCVVYPALRNFTAVCRE